MSYNQISADGSPMLSNHFITLCVCVVGGAGNWKEWDGRTKVLYPSLTRKGKKRENS
jgi:hypothetical protein